MLEKIKAMFTNIGNIHRPREAAASDTRQEIRRHDPDQERGKKDEGEHKKESFDIGDSASVSVDALALFLENFLRSLEQNTERRTPEIRAQNPETGHLSQSGVQEHTSGSAAQAASVYRHVGNAGKQTSILDAASAAAPSLSLPATEVRTIHRLLADLKTLSGSGVQLLQIERGESFLQSLVIAVDKAKNNL